MHPSNLLQKLQKWAHNFASENGIKTKMHFNKNTSAQKLKIGDKLLFSKDFYSGNNPK